MPPHSLHLQEWLPQSQKCLPFGPLWKCLLVAAVYPKILCLSAHHCSHAQFTPLSAPFWVIFFSSLQLWYLVLSMDFLLFLQMMAGILSQSSSSASWWMHCEISIVCNLCSNHIHPYIHSILLHKECKCVCVCKYVHANLCRRLILGCLFLIYSSCNFLKTVFLYWIWSLHFG